MAILCLEMEDEESERVLSESVFTEEQNIRYKTEKRGDCSILLVRRDCAVAE